MTSSHQNTRNPPKALAIAAAEGVASVALGMGAMDEVGVEFEIEVLLVSFSLVELLGSRLGRQCGR